MATTSRSLAFITGEMHAVLMFCQVICLTHPNPDLLLRKLDEAEQLGLANLAPEKIPEDILQGFESVMAALKRATQSVSAAAPPSAHPT